MTLHMYILAQFNVNIKAVVKLQVSVTEESIDYLSSHQLQTMHEYC